MLKPVSARRSAAYVGELGVVAGNGGAGCRRPTRPSQPASFHSLQVFTNVFVVIVTGSEAAADPPPGRAASAPCATSGERSHGQRRSKRDGAQCACAVLHASCLHCFPFSLCCRTLRLALPRGHAAAYPYGKGVAGENASSQAGVFRQSPVCDEAAAGGCRKRPTVTGRWQTGQAQGKAGARPLVAAAPDEVAPASFPGTAPGRAVPGGCGRRAWCRCGGCASSRCCPTRTDARRCRGRFTPPPAA